MAQRVVDVLEPVEVEEEHADRRFRAARFFQQRAEVVDEPRAVRQRRYGVGVGQRLQARARAAALDRRADERTHELHEVAVDVVERGAPAPAIGKTQAAVTGPGDVDGRSDVRDERRRRGIVRQLRQSAHVVDRERAIGAQRKPRERQAQRFAVRFDDRIARTLVERAGRDAEDAAARLDRRRDLLFGVLARCRRAHVEVANALGVRGDLPLLGDRGAEIANVQVDARGESAEADRNHRYERGQRMFARMPDVQFDAAGHAGQRAIEAG